MGLIYGLLNKTNGLVYIGATTCSLQKRWDEHIRDARTRCESFKLHQAIREDGPDSFLQFVVEKVPDEYLEEREEYWISVFDSYKNGYNGTMGGKGFKTFDHTKTRELWDNGLSIGEISKILDCSPQTVEKALQGHVGYSHYDSVRRGKRNQMRRVHQCDMEGRIIRTFESISDAAHEYGVDRSLISIVCRHKRPSGAGFCWRYEENLE